MDRIRLGVVIPMANEQDSAAALIDHILRVTSAVGRRRIYVVLDKVSKDGTRGIIERLAQQKPEVVLVWAPENRCVVDAYFRGYREAFQDGSDWILEMDAGFSHDPGNIPLFLEKMSQGYDCVFGTRFSSLAGLPFDNPKRMAVSLGGTLLATALLGTKLSDMTSGFEMFNRRAMEQILLRGVRSRAHFFQTELRAFCHGYNITEVPIRYRFASPGLGASSIREAFRELKGLVVLRFKGKMKAKCPVPAAVGEVRV